MAAQIFHSSVFASSLRAAIFCAVVGCQSGGTNNGGGSTGDTESSGPSSAAGTSSNEMLDSSTSGTTDVADASTGSDEPEPILPVFFCDPSYVFRIDEIGEHEISENGCMGLDVSPDKTKLLMWRRLGSGESEMRMLSAGDGSVILEPFADYRSIGWRDNDTIIAIYTNFSLSENELLQLDIYGQELWSLYLGGSSTSCGAGHYSLSPDAGRMVISCTFDNAAYQEIIVVDLDSGDTSTLATLGIDTDTGPPIWLSTGQILYTFGPEIFLHDPPRSPAVVLEGGTDQLRPMGPDGAVIFSLADGAVTVGTSFWAVSLPGNERESLLWLEDAEADDVHANANGTGFLYHDGRNISYAAIDGSMVVPLREGLTSGPAITDITW